MGTFGSVLVVGAGKMGGAILSAWLSDDESGLEPTSLVVQDPSPTPEMVDLLAKYDLVAEADARLDVIPDLVLVGVKPQIMDQVLPELAPKIGPQTLVVSIAAGKTLADIAKYFPQGTAIVRAMPNTPVMVEAGMIAFFGNEFVSYEQNQKLAALFSLTGSVAWLSREDQMDGVTAVSGSGPAYVFYMAECMIKAGVDAGLDHDLAVQLAENTIFGAGKLMVLSDEPASQLRENVTSKGGTTAAALEILMADNGLSPLISRAIKAAQERSKELSG